MTIFKKITAVFVGAIISFTVAFGGAFSSNAIRTSAATGAYPFDGTSVSEDLESVLDENGLSEFVGATEPELITVIEFAFAESALDCEYYSLYVYVYNPQKLNFSERTGANVVNIAVSYGEDGEPNGYDDLPLIPCGATEDNLVYKYRIEDEEGRLLSNARAQNAANGKRRYDVAGIQLWTTGAASAEDYYAAHTAYYEGYAQGMGDEAITTATLKMQNEKTIQLDVHPTFYRPEGVQSESNRNVQDTLYSVYFTIPSRYIEKYGELYAVHAEYLKALTTPVLVTNNNSAYEAILPYLDRDISDIPAGTIGYSYITNFSQSTTGVQVPIPTYSGAVGYNVPPSQSAVVKFNVSEEISLLHYLFLLENTDFVSSEEFKARMVAYSQTNTNWIEGTSYSKDLFSSYDSQKSEVELKKGETLPLTSVTFEEWLPFLGITKPIPDSFNVPVIQEVEMCASATQLKEDYYINEEDFNEVSEVYERKENGDKMYVFHYAVDDYIVSEATCMKHNATWYDVEDNAFLAQNTVHINFDIIDITLDDGEKLTVLGVVANPIDVIPDFTPPPDVVGENILPYIIAIIFIGAVGIPVTRAIKKEAR